MVWAGLACSDVRWWVGAIMSKKEKKKKRKKLVLF